MARRRKFWGWGYEDEPIRKDQKDLFAAMAHARFPDLKLDDLAEPTIDEMELRLPRLRAPGSLAHLFSEDRYDRAAHTYGKSTRDLLRGAARDFAEPPDFVAYPETEADVVAILDWAADADVAVVPYGGGTSVVGGVEGGHIRGDWSGWISLDLGRLDKILEIDRASRAARIQAGILGPALEEGLRPQGLTLRHFPQSFEFSSLGGWIATRAGGHFATLYTHVDDFVESLRVVTPTGTLETRRLPGSGAGPSPDRMFIGSEGTLGVLTEAWMRLQDRPRFRATATVKFPEPGGFVRGAEAARLLAQSGLYPTNCRLIDAAEAATQGAGTGDEAILIVGFESADHALDPWIARAAEICRDAGGVVPDEAIKTRTDTEGARGGAAGAWREGFLKAPYYRDVLILLGLIAETFETAVTWDRFEAFDAAVRAAGEDALRRVCGGGVLTCRFTHVYPDGPAPYYTVLAPGRRGARIEQWGEIKAAVSEAIGAAGGTITHHHAVGRDHRPWYDRERPDLFARALRAAKRELDPDGILNPGVLIDP